MPNEGKTVLAGHLAADPDRIAPVSGCRCRSCGANAKRRQPLEQWCIINAAAWCPDCYDPVTLTVKED